MGTSRSGPTGRGGVHLCVRAAALSQIAALCRVLSLVDLLSLALWEGAIVPRPGAGLAAPPPARPPPFLLRCCLQDGSSHQPLDQSAAQQELLVGDVRRAGEVQPPGASR